MNEVAPPAARRRLPAKIREQSILDEAIRHFADHGAPPQMRELARRMGVTHPLLYRYFKDRDTLIERIYEELFLARWRPEWEIELADHRVDLETRLVAFYGAYLATIDDSSWMRIYIYSGLKGVDFNRRYRNLLRAKVILPIASGLRHLGGPPSAPMPPGESEIRAALGLHGQLFYLLVRKWIYRLPVPQIDRALIAMEVRQFLAGAPAILREISGTDMVTKNSGGGSSDLL